MKAAVRSRPAAPAQRTATTRWCPPSPLACPSSRTMARSTPTPTARPEWVSVWMGTCNFLFRCPSLFFFLQSCQWKEFAKCAPDRVKMLPLFSHSYVRDVWNGGRAGCFLLQNEALLQRVVFEELFLQFQKGQHPGETTGEGFLCCYCDVFRSLWPVG